VVTIPSPFSTAAGSRPWRRLVANGPERLPAPAAPAAAETTTCAAQTGGTYSPESFYWHPCRKSASPRTACRRAMHEIRIARRFIQGFHGGPVKAVAEAGPALSPDGAGLW